jgi:hypothetical protein
MAGSRGVCQSHGEATPKVRGLPGSQNKGAGEPGAGRASANPLERGHPKVPGKGETPLFWGVRDRLSQTTRNKNWLTPNAGCINLPRQHIWGLNRPWAGILRELFRGIRA